MPIRKVLVVYTIPRVIEQKKTLDFVTKALREKSMSFEMANRDKLKKSQFKGKDLIIAVGGDGTFLRAAHFVEKQLLFGVNSDVQNKEGFFMKSNRENFRQKLKNILNHSFKIKKLPRLEASIDNKPVESLALNEFFLGPRKSYHAAKYIIESYGIKERQKSSGVLVTTALGSCAWAKSCIKKTLPLKSEKFQFVVREPYEWKVFRNYKLKYGILGKNEKLKITSEMLDGVLVADSVGKEYNFSNKSKAIIKMSKKHVNAIWE